VWACSEAPRTWGDKSACVSTDTTLDNFHRPAITAFDRHRVHAAMAQLGVVPRPHIMQAVDSFAQAHFTAPSPTSVTIGLHYRGNDHWEELPGGQLVPISLYVSADPPVAGRAELRSQIGYMCNESGALCGMHRRKVCAMFCGSVPCWRPTQ
jgi:hypothetical protein